jgi:hypothetical protein
MTPKSAWTITMITSHKPTLNEMRDTIDQYVMPVCKDGVNVFVVYASTIQCGDIPALVDTNLSEELLQSLLGNTKLLELAHKFKV